MQSTPKYQDIFLLCLARMTCFPPHKTAQLKEMSSEKKIALLNQFSHRELNDSFLFLLIYLNIFEGDKKETFENITIYRMQPVMHIENLILYSIIAKKVISFLIPKSIFLKLCMFLSLIVFAT